MKGWPGVAAGPQSEAGASRAAGGPGSGRPRDPVLPMLGLLALAAAWQLAFVTVAPNRLVSGRGVTLFEWVGGHSGALPWLLSLAPALVLGALALLPATPARHGGVAAAAGLWLASVTWLAGEAARALPAQRVAFGAGYWALVLLTWAIATEALRRLRWSPALRAAAQVALWLPIAVLAVTGQLSELALLREWAQRDDVFREAFVRHLQIVVAALLPALVIGLPLGVAAARHERFGRAAAAVLGAVQTVPSIALFGLLIAPLAALGAWWPGSGIRGVGLAPAAVALVLYALLPIVLGVAAGLKQVPSGTLEAARGMGLRRSQRLLQVELPLALPALLSALRVAAVQLVGLAVVAALIGAGGLGSFVFQGLAAGALDLVLLGVVPVVALALVFDASLAAAAAAAVPTTEPA